MAEIIMYKTPVCPYCKRAKDLLKGKGVTEINEIDITTDRSLMAEMMEKSGGRRTVPQIFIGGTHVGGYDDMNAMDGRGELDSLLNG